MYIISGKTVIVCFEYTIKEFYNFYNTVFETPSSIMSLNDS